MTTTPSDRGTDTSEAGTEGGPAAVPVTGKGTGKGKGKDQTTPFHQAHDVPVTTTGGGSSTG